MKMQRFKETLRKLPRTKYIFLLFVALYMIYVIVKCAGGLSELPGVEKAAASVGIVLFSVIALCVILISGYALITGEYMENYLNWDEEVKDAAGQESQETDTEENTTEGDNMETCGNTMPQKNNETVNDEENK